MLNNIEPSVEPWGTPKSISNLVLCELFTLVLSFLSAKYLLNNFEAAKVTHTH